MVWLCVCLCMNFTLHGSFCSNHLHQVEPGLLFLALHRAALTGFSFPFNGDFVFLASSLGKEFSERGTGWSVVFTAYL